MLRYRVVVYSSKLPEDTIRHVWPVLLAYSLMTLSDFGAGDTGQGAVQPIGQIVFQSLLEIGD